MESRAPIHVALKFGSTLSYVEIIQEREMLLQDVLIGSGVNPQGELRMAYWEYCTTMFSKTEATQYNGLAKAERHTALRTDT